MKFRTVYGVDFSGARLAGRNTWVARIELRRRGSLTPKGRRMRRTILDGLAPHLHNAERDRRLTMRNGGGDALDAVLAAVGAARSWRTSDHRLIARHERYPREGRRYV